MRRRQCAVVLLALLFVTTNASAGNGNVAAVGLSAPINDALPTISGAPVVGSKLTADPGKWNGPSTKYDYQWQHCASNGASCSPIAGGTAQIYLPVASDLSSTLRVTVTANNKNGTTVATSNSTSAVTGTTSSPTTSSTTTTTSTTTPSSTSTTTTTPTTTTTSTNTTTTTTTTTTTPTSTTTTTTTAPTGTVRYRENWESGTLDTANWGHQCRDNLASGGGITRGTVTPTTADASSGSWSGRIDLPADTVNRQACEFLHSRLVDPNTDDYYALAVKFPTNWQEPSTAFWGMSVAQFNYEGINSSPLGLTAHADNVTIVVNSGACPPSGVAPGCPYYSGNGGDAPRGMAGPLLAIPKGQLALGVWHQLVVHVRWTLGTDGVLEVWHRVRGGTWSKTVSMSGVPTLQTGTTFNGTVLTASNLATWQDVDKFGLYRGPSSFAIPVWFDDWCRATTFSASVSCLG